MKNFFLHNISMKVIALGLAIIVWVYVNGQIIRQ
jgi:YbbR domain-containing protein